MDQDSHDVALLWALVFEMNASFFRFPKSPKLTEIMDNNKNGSWKSLLFSTTVPNCNNDLESYINIQMLIKIRNKVVPGMTLTTLY